jgi:hypothetical protein
MSDACTAQDFSILSIRMRDWVAGYDLRPTEERLVHLMVLDSYDRGVTRAKVRLDYWGGRLRLRLDKLERVLREVINLGLVDVNQALGTFELRPDHEQWSRSRAFRPSDRVLDPELTEIPGPVRNPELGLVAERPLSEALSEVAREKAIESGAPICGGDRDWRALYSRLLDAVQSGDEAASAAIAADFSAGTGREGVAEKSAGFGRKNPPVEIASVLPGEFSCRAGPAEKSAAIASLASVQRAELARGPSRTGQVSEKSAGAGKGTDTVRAYGASRSGEAWNWLLKVDSNRTLQGRFASQWRELCERDPDFVLNRLRGAYENHLERLANGEQGLRRVDRPLAWMARKAFDEGRITAA